MISVLWQINEQLKQQPNDLNYMVANGKGQIIYSFIVVILYHY